MQIERFLGRQYGQPVKFTQVDFLLIGYANLSVRKMSLYLTRRRLDDDLGSGRSETSFGLSGLDTRSCREGHDLLSVAR